MSSVTVRKANGPCVSRNLLVALNWRNCQRRAGKPAFLLRQSSVALRREIMPAFLRNVIRSKARNEFAPGKQEPGMCAP